MFAVVRCRKILWLLKMVRQFQLIPFGDWFSHELKEVSREAERKIVPLLRFSFVSFIFNHEAMMTTKSKPRRDRKERMKTKVSAADVTAVTKQHESRWVEGLIISYAYDRDRDINSPIDAFNAVYNSSCPWRSQSPTNERTLWIYYDYDNTIHIKMHKPAQATLTCSLK